MNLKHVLFDFEHEKLIAKRVLNAA